MHARAGGSEFALRPKGEVVSTLLDRHRQSLAADPEDRRAFEALQEHLFLEGDWDEFVSVCQRRLEAPSLKSDVPARVALLFRLGQVLQVVGGLVLIAFGAAMIFGYVSTFSLWLLEMFPALGGIG